MTRIRAARESLGIPLRDLAKQAGITEQYLRDIETGRFRPGMKTALKLAAALNLSLDFIAHDPEYQRSEQART